MNLLETNNPKYTHYINKLNSRLDKEDIMQELEKYRDTILGHLKNNNLEKIESETTILNRILANNTFDRYREDRYDRTDVIITLKILIIGILYEKKIA